MSDGVRIARAARRVIGPAAWAAGLVPLALIVYRGATGGLGANPIEAVTHRTGFAAITLLMLTLAVSPVRRVTGWNALAPVRRTLGLLAFGYALLHFVTYLVDQSFSLGYVVEDVRERPWVTVGFTALVLLVPLALTSTRAAIRRLGKRWQKLHRLVYLAGALAVLHFVLLVKADLLRPLVFAAVFAALMVFRVPAVRRAAETRTRADRGAPKPAADRPRTAGRTTPSRSGTRLPAGEHDDA